MTNKTPLITVVTVVFNGEKFIEKTIQSVINQTYPHIEYIVIDGKSKDLTVDIIKKYEDKINHWVSEPDKGIYDAMNKAITCSTGEWINFMNAGDIFFDNDVVQAFVSGLPNEDIAVVYGNTEIIFDDKNSVLVKVNNHSHKYHHKFVHQSAFIRNDIMKKYLYDTSFRIAGDTDFFTKIYNKGYKFFYIDKPFARFDASGVSATINRKVFMEEYRIGRKYNRFYILRHLGKYTLMLCKRLVRKLMPQKLENKMRVIYNKIFNS